MHGLDEFIIQAVAEMRSPLLNRVMLDITALGSATLIAIQGAIAAVLLIYISHTSKRELLQMAVAAGGAQLWVEVIKRALRSPRPEMVERLQDAVGFSYPSGHAAVSTAFYLTLAVIVSRPLQGRARIAVRIPFGVLILLIGFSRIYIGVHYPSDVLSGFLLGLLWFIMTVKLLGQEYQ